jgi:hypothetical protein
MFYLAAKFLRPDTSRSDFALVINLVVNQNTVFNWKVPADLLTSGLNRFHIIFFIKFCGKLTNQSVGTT